MADISKLKFENGSYNIKDTVARNEINNLDQKIESNTNQLETEISNLDQNIDSEIGLLKTDINTYLNQKNKLMELADSFPEGKVEVVAGILRQNTEDRSKWDYISDTGHRPVGLKYGHANSLGLDISIEFAKTYKRIISFVCSPDETFVQQLGMTCGARVGANVAFLRLNVSLALDAQISYSSTTDEFSIKNGLYVNRRVNSATFNNGTLSLIHDRMFEQVAIVSDFLPTNAPDGMPHTALIKGTGFSQTAVGVAFKDTTGNIVTNLNGQIACKLSRMYNGAIYTDGSEGWDIDLSNGNIFFLMLAEV